MPRKKHRIKCEMLIGLQQGKVEQYKPCPQWATNLAIDHHKSPAMSVVRVCDDCLLTICKTEAEKGRLLLVDYKRKSVQVI